MLHLLVVTVVLLVYSECEEQQQPKKLVTPNVERDGDNHVLTVSIQVRDYSRIMDTKVDEILVGLRDEGSPPLNKVLCNFLGEVLHINPKLIEVVEGHSEDQGKKVEIDGSAITVLEIQERILIALRESIEEERYLKPSIKHREIYY